MEAVVGVVEVMEAAVPTVRRMLVSMEVMLDVMVLVGPAGVMDGRIGVEGALTIGVELRVCIPFVVRCVVW